MAVSPMSSLSKSCDLESFEALVHKTFCPMTVDVNAGLRSKFKGGLVSQRLGTLGFSAIKSSPLMVSRRSADIATYADASYLVKIQVEGEGYVRHWGQDTRLVPGDFTLCRNSEPYELEFPSEFCQVVLSVPVDVMEECVDNPTQFLGMRMDSDVGANGIFTNFVSSMAYKLGTMDGDLAKRLELNVMDLLSTTLCYAHRARRKDLMQDGVKREYLRRVKQFIRKNLSDERLCPDLIAGAHDITTRYLHMLFESEEASVSRYIIRARLNSCKMAFLDPMFKDYSVSDIGFQFGFKDASHFSRTFKGEFGESPAKYRAMHLS